MSYRVRIIFLIAAAAVAFPERSPAPVIFRPSEKVKYKAPGEVEISGNANEMFAEAEAAANSGDRGRAIKIYKRMVKRYPRSDKAPEATYRAAQLTELEGDLVKAAPIYRGLVETFPQSPRFQEAIEAQFRIGEVLLGGKKRKILGVPIGSNLDEAVEIFAAIVRSAPYGRYTARAQYNIGRAREKQASPDLAIDAYQSVVEKFPNDPLAVDAQYQIGYIWFAATRAGTYDPTAADRARVAFQDFLFRFPKSEKAAQARENLALLDRRLTKGSLEIAKYYDKAKNYRAAVLYYNEVIRQQPGSPESTVAQTRIAELRSKVGDAALQSAADVAERRAKASGSKKTASATSESPGREERPPTAPEMRGNPDEIAPLPPVSPLDSLPPAATTDSPPDVDPAIPAEPSPSPPDLDPAIPAEPSPTPEASATP